MQQQGNITATALLNQDTQLLVTMSSGTAVLLSLPDLGCVASFPLNAEVSAAASCQ